jgi:hypothetical protein
MARRTYERDIRNNAAWSFETARFFVGFYAEDEYSDPADSFCDQEDIDMVRNGDVEWFTARVSVYLKADERPYDPWTELGADYLGGCAYKNVSDFYKERKGYFSDMVWGAVTEARKKLRRMGEIAGTMRDIAVKA